MLLFSEAPSTPPCGEELSQPAKWPHVSRVPMSIGEVCVNYGRKIVISLISNIILGEMHNYRLILCTLYQHMISILLYNETTNQLTICYSDFCTESWGSTLNTKCDHCTRSWASSSLTIYFLGIYLYCALLFLPYQYSICIPVPHPSCMPSPSYNYWMACMSHDVVWYVELLVCFHGGGSNCSKACAILIQNAEFSDLLQQPQVPKCYLINYTILLYTLNFFSPNRELSQGLADKCAS